MEQVQNVYRVTLIAALVAVLLATGVSAAMAQQIPCAPRTAMVENLEKSYAESRQSIAITSDGRLLEVLTSPSGTWSILMTAPGGPACLVAAGDDWHSLPPRPVGQVS